MGTRPCKLQLAGVLSGSWSPSTPLRTGFQDRIPNLEVENDQTSKKLEEECRFNAAEVLSLILEDRLEEGRPVPPPSTEVEHAHWVAPDPNIQSALLIRLSREAEQKSLAELARTLDTSWPAAERLESPRHWPTLRQLDRAAAALGKRLVLPFE